MKKLIVGTIAIASFMVLPGQVQAATIVGTFTTASLGNVRVGDSWIDWGHIGPTFESATYTNCDPGPNGGACVINGTTTGDIFFDAATGAFASLVGDFGTLKDLEDDFAPVDTAFSLADFIGNTDGYQFTATFIDAGTGTLAGCTSVPGDVCTPPGSQFTLTNLADTDGDGTADSVLVGFTISGTVIMPDGSTGTWRGEFSTQVGMSALEAILEIDRVGWVQSSHSGSFRGEIQAIPEPATLLTFGAGTALLAAHRRRRAKKNSNI